MLPNDMPYVQDEKKTRISKKTRAYQTHSILMGKRRLFSWNTLHMAFCIYVYIFLKSMKGILRIERKKYGFI